MQREAKIQLIALGVLLITLLPKVLLTSTVRAPTSEAVLAVVSDFLHQEGFVSTSADFAGEKSLMSIRGDCLAYVIPISHQGWHQRSIVQHALNGKEAWFVSEGVLSSGQQKIFVPLIMYYARLLINYLGVDEDYAPVIAVVADRGCRVQALDWHMLPGVPFRRGLR